MIHTLINIGDIHLRGDDFFSVGFENFTQWFDKKFPDSNKETTEIFIAGDVFNKVSILPQVAAQATILFNLFFKKAVRVYVVLGNHDYGLNKYTVVNAKPFLEKLGAIVIDGLQVLTTGNGFKVLCLPWMYGCTHSKVNEFIESLLEEEFDAVVSHWEIKPLFGSNFVDLSKVKAHTFACGHIHQHNDEPKYLGSILPNSIAENKEWDQSVIRALVKDNESGKFKEYELAVPSFIQVLPVKIGSLTDLDLLEKRKEIFYKIIHPGSISQKSVMQQATLNGVHVYSTQVEVEETKIDYKEFKIENYQNQNNVEILQSYKEVFQLSDEELEICKQILSEVA